MHVVVEVLQHVTSPLTSALTIFGTYKASHVPKIRIWFRAKRILARAMFNPAVPLTPLQQQQHVQQQQVHVLQQLTNHPPTGSAGFLAPTTHELRHGAHPTSTHPGNVRHFGTIAGQRRLVSSSPTLSSLLNSTGVVGPRLGSRRFNSTSAAAAASSASSSAAQSSVSSSLPGAVHQFVEPAVTVANAAIDSTAASAASASLAFEHAAHASSNWLSSWMVMSPITGNEVFWSVCKFEELIGYCHMHFNMPWWASILTTTLAFRFAVLPLNVSLVRNTARLYLIKPEIARLGKVMETGTPGEQEQAAREFFSVLKQGKAHPLKNIVSPILFPFIFLSLFGSVLDICTHLPEVQSGGPLWFPDLSSPDASNLLPVVSALSWLATIELASGAVFHMPPWMHLSSRILAVAFIPVTQTMPAGIFIFWITSNLFAATRAFVVRTPRVQRLVGIPPVSRT